MCVGPCSHNWGVISLPLSTCIAMGRDIYASSPEQGREVGRFLLGGSIWLVLTKMCSNDWQATVYLNKRIVYCNVQELLL